ncbi:mitochondrial intermembrane space translocase subunit [Xylaria sp. FL1777]|nr:mitochondrial intermembrane space translocase subunit [Xylaria sp. FL1777]
MDYASPSRIERENLRTLIRSNAVYRLTQAETRELEQRMQKRQVKEFLGTGLIANSSSFGIPQLFSNLVDHCFMSCIDDFTSKSLSTRESGCVTRCVQKQMALSQRLSERFQEHNAQMTQQQQQGQLR